MVCLIVGMWKELESGKKNECRDPQEHNLYDTMACLINKDSRRSSELIDMPWKRNNNKTEAAIHLSSYLILT